MAEQPADKCENPPNRIAEEFAAIRESDSASNYARDCGPFPDLPTGFTYRSPDAN
jgi:hypothetical protein